MSITARYNTLKPEESGRERGEGRTGIQCDRTSSKTQSHMCATASPSGTTQVQLTCLLERTDGLEKAAVRHPCFDCYLDPVKTEEDATTTTTTAVQ